MRYPLLLRGSYYSIPMVDDLRTMKSFINLSDPNKMTVKKLFDIL